MLRATPGPEREALFFFVTLELRHSRRERARNFGLADALAAHIDAVRAATACGRRSPERSTVCRAVRTCRAAPLHHLRARPQAIGGGAKTCLLHGQRHVLGTQAAQRGVRELESVILELVAHEPHC